QGGGAPRRPVRRGADGQGIAGGLAGAGGGAQGPGCDPARTGAAHAVRVERGVEGGTGRDERGAARPGPARAFPGRSGTGGPPGGRRPVAGQGPQGRRSADTFTDHHWASGTGAGGEGSGTSAGGAGEGGTGRYTAVGQAGAGARAAVG